MEAVGKLNFASNKPKLKPANGRTGALMVGAGLWNNPVLFEIGRCAGWRTGGASAPTYWPIQGAGRAL